MRLRLLAVAAALAGCTTSVPPTNPYDPATPPDHQAKAALRGTLQTPLFASKAGFQVGLRRAGVPMSPTLAEADGSFVFDQLVPGDYSLEPSPAGFTPLSIPVRLAPGQDLDVGAICIEDFRNDENELITYLTLRASHLVSTLDFEEVWEMIEKVAHVADRLEKEIYARDLH